MARSQIVKDNNTLEFVFTVLVKLLMGMQGFWNALIYFRPNFRRASMSSFGRSSNQETSSAVQRRGQHQLTPLQPRYLTPNPQPGNGITNHVDNQDEKDKGTDEQEISPREDEEASSVQDS